MTTKQLQNKCRGSLVGGAIGDAFGYPVEFVSSFEKIEAKYGVGGIMSYDLSSQWRDKTSGNALLSDDTQMTLYTAEGLLEAERSGRPAVSAVCGAYLAWFGPQAGRKTKTVYKSELALIDELNQRRAPGNTCLTALDSIWRGCDPQNSSKGCGGVMRVAPVGIYGASHGWNLETTGRLAGEIAELTHLHPLSTYSSAMAAVITQLCVDATDVGADGFRDIVVRSLEVVTGIYGETAPAIDDFRAVVRKAVMSADDSRNDWEIIENSLGGGWVAEETLAIAIFSVLRHHGDFNACMISAVNHGGDSDSTGAVAGNIIGALLGYDALPEKFTGAIQLRGLLLSMADRLCGIRPEGNG